MLTVQNAAASALGIQSNYQISTAQNVTTRDAAIQQAAAILAMYSQLPSDWTVNTRGDSSGYYPGRLQTVSFSYPLETGALLNGNWLTQQVQATWIPGVENRPEPFGHFRYTLEFINTSQISTYINTLQNLANTGPLNNQQPTTGTAPGAAIPILDSRTFLVKDSTVGTSIADHVPVILPIATPSPRTYQVGTGMEIAAILGVVITADLQVKINKKPLSGPTTSWTITIPMATAVDDILTTVIDTDQFHYHDIFSADVIASDGQIVPRGVASFTIVWTVPK